MTRVRAIVLDPRTNDPVSARIWPWPYLTELQRLVDGYVTVVYNAREPHWHAYIAEQAQNRGLPFNARATELTRMTYTDAAPIHGTAVIVGTGRHGVDIDVPHQVLRQLGLT